MRKYINVILIAVILMSASLQACKSKPPAAAAAPIEILEPSFEVTSIYILQADLVVTEFEAVIKIDNPNEFAMELSSIVYELYGNNRFWAGGKTNNIFQIPASASGETRFTFSMNFIDMSRPLLDDVIAMRRVNYRFKGQAQVQPNIPNSSAFGADFDCSGYSEVKKR